MRRNSNGKLKSVAKCITNLVLAHKLVLCWDFELTVAPTCTFRNVSARKLGATARRFVPCDCYLQQSFHINKSAFECAFVAAQLHHRVAPAVRQIVSRKQRAARQAVAAPISCNMARKNKTLERFGQSMCSPTHRHLKPPPEHDCVANTNERTAHCTSERSIRIVLLES